MLLLTAICAQATEQLSPELEEARRLSQESEKLTLENKWKEARPPAERVLELRKQALGPDHADVGRALHSLAAIDYKLNDFDRAEKGFQEAIRIREQAGGGEPPELAASLGGLANIHQIRNEYSAARPLYLRALEILEKAYGPDHPETGLAVKRLANHYEDARDSVLAKLMYQRALSIAEKTYGTNHQMYARNLSNLAISHMTLGDYSTAESMFLRAIEIFEATYGKESIEYGPALINLGNLYYKMEEYEKAVKVYLRILAIVEKEEPDDYGITYVLNNLGNTYVDLAEYEKAGGMFQRALVIRQKMFGADHPQVAFGLENIANLHRARGDFVTAEKLYLQTLAIFEKAFGADHMNLVTALRGLAMVSMATGDISRGVSYQARANAIIERNLSYNLVLGSEREKLAYLESLSDDADRTLSLHILGAPENPEARDSAVAMVLQRKGRVLDSMTGSLAALRARFGAEDQARMERMNEATSKLADLVLSGPQKITLEEHLRKVEALEKEVENLENDISLRSAGFYEHQQAITTDAVRTAIPPDSALLEFAIYHPSDPKAADAKPGKARYVVYVLRQNGDARWKDLGEASVIDRAIDEFRIALRNPKSTNATELGRIVDEKLLEPVRPLLGNATRLLISPVSAVSLVPFEALVDDQKHFAIERYSCTYLTSGRDLLRLQAPRKSKSDPVVVADPVYGDSAQQFAQNAQNKGRSISVLADAYFAPLAGTAREAEAIKSLFANATLLTGKLATESSLKKVVAPEILHVATHGFFLTDTPAESGNGTGSTNGNPSIGNPLLRSGLALAGANEKKAGTDDGILTALEASGLNLWGTRLVTLSACDTGVGEIKNAEGVYGLRRAFVLAGAESLVMSLWPVSDFITRELMTQYYKGLKDGQGRGDALRTVQLSMLKNHSRSHPFYWASFIQFGEWANLSGAR